VETAPSSPEDQLRKTCKVGAWHTEPLSKVPYGISFRRVEVVTEKERRSRLDKKNIGSRVSIYRCYFSQNERETKGVNDKVREGGRNALARIYLLSRYVLPDELPIIRHDGSLILLFGHSIFLRADWQPPGSDDILSGRIFIPMRFDKLPVVPRPR